MFTFSCVAVGFDGTCKLITYGRHTGRNNRHTIIFMHVVIMHRMLGICRGDHLEVNA